MTSTAWRRILGLSAVTGLRGTGGVSLISWSAAHGNLPVLKRSPFAVLATRQAAYATAAGLWSESMADLTLPVPARSSPQGLAGRAVAGGFTGVLVGTIDGAPLGVSAAVGAGVAMVAGAGASFVRRWATTRLHVPDAVIALVEDGLVVAAAALLPRGGGRDISGS